MNKHKFYLLLITIIAFLFRSYAYFILCDKFNYNGLTWGYIEEAQNILQGKEWFMGMVNGHYQLLTVHPKGFSVLLLPFLYFFPIHYMQYMHILMILCDSLVCVILFQITKNRFHNTRIGYVSAILWAINPLAIFNVTQDLPDAFSCFFLAVIIWIYDYEWGEEWKKFLILGLAIGIVHYFRAEFLLIIAIILFVELVTTKNSFKKWLQKSFLIVMAFLLTNSAWMVYSYQKTGHVMMASQTAYGTAFEAIGEKKDNQLGIEIGDENVNRIAIENGFDGAWTYDANQFFRKKFISYVMTYPWEYSEIIMKYRFDKAFIPTTYVWFNLNRSYEQMNSKIICKDTQGIINRACIFSFSNTLKFEGKWARNLSLIFLLFSILYLFIVMVNKTIKKDLFLFLLYLYFPIMIMLLKQIEPRNVLANLPILTIFTSYVLYVIVTYLFHFLFQQNSLKNNS